MIEVACKHRGIVRASAIKALGETVDKPDRKLSRILKQFTGQASCEHVRRVSIEALMKLGEKSAVAAFRCALHDSSAYVRAESVKALAHVAGKRAKSWIEQMTADPSPFVRYRANTELGHLMR